MIQSDIAGPLLPPGDHTIGVDSWACELRHADQVPVAQLDRALASEAKGYRFDSCRGYS